MNDLQEKTHIFSGSTLKLIAIITMLIDHIGAAILYYTVKTDSQILMYHIVRNIGRVSFPIFCFLLVEGFLHTHDAKRYAIQLGVFALLSEIPFDLAFTREGTSIWRHQNVFFTLLIALLVLMVYQYIEVHIKVDMALQFVLHTFVSVAGCGLAYFMRTDYSFAGVFSILILYLFRSNRIWQIIFGAITFFWEPWAIFGFIPILLYNGERGFQKGKYFFYWFYPVHLFLLYGIAHFMMHLH